MKKLKTICAMAIVALSALVTCASSNTAANTNADAMPCDLNASNDGMFFTSCNVVDNVKYGEINDASAFYLIYDDVDAGMEYEAIRVDKPTYETVVNAIENGAQISGTLEASGDFEAIVYSLNVED